MTQSDGHIPRKKNTEVRSEWNNDVCLWSVFSKWTFDRSLKTLIFTQQRSVMTLTLNCATYFRCLFVYVGIVWSNLPLWHILIWLSGRRVHSLSLPLSKTGVLNLHKWTYLLTNPMLNCPLLNTELATLWKWHNCNST